MENGGNRIDEIGTFMVVQWLRLQCLQCRRPGFHPSSGNRACMSQLKILHAAKKSPYSQIKKKKKKRIVELKTMVVLKWETSKSREIDKKHDKNVMIIVPSVQFSHSVVSDSL